MPKGAKDFIDEVGRNPELRNQIYKQSSGVVLNLAKQHGYEFSPQDLHAALHEKLGVVPAAADAEADSSNCVVVVLVASARNR